MNPQRRIAELTLSELSAALILGHLVLRAARNNDAERNLRSISLMSACNKNILNRFFFLYLSIKARIHVLTYVAERDQIKTCTEEGIDPNAACWHHNVALPDTFSTKCGKGFKSKVQSIYIICYRETGLQPRKYKPYKTPKHRCTTSKHQDKLDRVAQQEINLASRSEYN